MELLCVGVYFFCGEGEWRCKDLGGIIYRTRRGHTDQFAPIR